VVLEKSLAVGIGGIVATNVRMAVTGMGLKGYTVVAGLGGPAITMKSLHRPVREGRSRRAGTADLPRPRLERSSSNKPGTGARSVRRSAAPAPSAEEHPARPRHRRRLGA
jgi:hypothetical protein